MLKDREAGVSNMAVAASFQIASVEVAKVEGISDQAIEQGFVIAMEQAETVVAQAIRMRTYAH
jgi:hypothetical protein